MALTSSIYQLRPMTCGPLSRDRDDPSHIGLNDALGNYSLTLIDSLSTLAILAGGPLDGSYTGPQALGDFQDGVARFVEHYGDGRPGPTGEGIRARGFDLDSKVQVFETVIRGVGGLLSAHLFAIGELPITGYHPRSETSRTEDDPLELTPIPWPSGFGYDGQLLRLALDLSERLLPAFYTGTGIPYPRVNLRHGIPFYLNSPLHGVPEELRETADHPEITETCSAGAGSLILEFTVLSRLSGDQRFEQAAKRAFWEVWKRRSEIGLIGNGIDPELGVWIGPHAGIGAGMDSFFEYALKSHILLSGQGVPNTSTTQWRNAAGRLDPNALHPPLSAEMHSSDAFLEAWHQAHASVKQYLYTDQNHYPYYSNNNRATGQPFTMWIDSLGAFYPGLLALAGEVEEAIEANLVYTALWTRYSALPERWSISLNNVEGGLGWWPGRPEFIESTYYIYRATRDPWYLRVGEMVLKDIKRRCLAPCGWAGLQDVRTGEKQDRMESFFLGETTKYMYLLFDSDHPLNKLDAAYVFTTEGHPLIIPKEQRSRGKRNKSSIDEPAPYRYYDESFTNSCPCPETVGDLSGSATAARPNLFHVSRFTDLYRTPNFHGPVEMVEVEDPKKGRTVTMYKATSNYTLFPWTLPPTMLPQNGTSAAPPEKILFWIEFPTSDLASSLLAKFGNSLVWQSHLGPTVRSIDGLKLQLERRQSDVLDAPVWRITHVGNTQLGKHETVYFYAEHVQHFKDEAFSCFRRQDAVEITLLFDDSDEWNTSMAFATDESAVMPTAMQATSEQKWPQALESDFASESLLQSLLRAVSSVFEPGITALPLADEKNGPLTAGWEAYTSTGPGAFPVPPVSDTPTAGNPFYNAKKPISNFPWKSVFLAGLGCDAPLPDFAPRQHQVIVMLRGGCSFSDKIANIPSFSSAASSSLQLLVVIDESDATESVVRPLLDTEQLTPSGLKRLNGVPMVFLRGSEGTYELMGRAAGVGMRRKYWVESQGLMIENAVVL